jgi:subtilisin family serine protease
LIVKVSISLGETSTATSETSAALSTIEKTSLLQSQLNSKTDSLAKKYSVVKKVSITNLSNKGLTNLSNKGFVFERWEFASEKDLLAASKLIEKEKGIISIRRDFAMQISAIPNDPGFSQLWGMQSLRAPSAWDTTKGSESVVVAVLDTGIDLDHPDLVNNLWTNPGEIAGDGIDNDNNGYEDDIHGWDFVSGDATPNDDIGNGFGSPGHGTHVAGTIAAEGNNSVGVVGVNWQASLMALRICGPSGCWLSNFWAALIYAYNNGAQVANASFGGPYEPLQAEEDIIAGVAEPGYSPLQKGVLLVAAAGNAASNNDAINFCPACYQLPNVVSVAATTSSNDNLASFSNYGSQKVTIAAPGDGIYSTIPPGAFGYSGYYGAISGTSMASPHVAGVAALFQSMNMSWKPSAIKMALIKSARKTASLSGKVFSGGVANAQEILNIIQEPSPFLSIDFKGTGSGKVQVGSDECTSDCVLEISSGTSLELTVTQSDNSTFTSWGGDCLGSIGTSCSWIHMTRGTFVSVTFNGPPLVTHEQSNLVSSESIEVWNIGTYKNYYGNYALSSLSADAKIRARAIFRKTTNWWCSHELGETGGVTVRDEELDFEEATWRAPYIGDDFPLYISNCDSFGKNLQISDDGNYLITTLDPQIHFPDFPDPTQDIFSCGTILYKKDLNGAWSSGVAITPNNLRDCYAETTRTPESWSGSRNWLGAILAPDQSKIFVKGSKNVFVVNLSGDTVASREEISLPTNCRPSSNLSTNSNGTKLLIPTRSCQEASNALLYTKASNGWILTKKFTETSSFGYGTTATVLSRDATTLALSYTNETGSGVLVYELKGSAWTMVRNLKSSPRFFNFTDCKFLSANNMRLICSSSNVDVGNNPLQGVVIVYDRNGSSWSNVPYQSILWDTNGIPLEQMSFQSANADGTVIDATIGGKAIGAEGLDSTFMGITFVLRSEGPTNLMQPEISGSMRVGSTVTSTEGTWSGSPSPNFEFAWYSCISEIAPPATSCTPISGARDRNMTLTTSLINRYVRVAVTAINNSGTRAVFSNAAGVVGTLPAAAGASKINGVPAVGNSLEVSIPQWSGTPTPTYTYSWLKCDVESRVVKSQSPAGCVGIDDANSRTYTPTSSDFSKFLLVQITGTNIHGSVSVWSASTKQVLSGPTNISAPVITGTAAVGQTLKATAGSWSGAPIPRLTYQWLSCANEISTDCTLITGATRNTFKLATAQSATYIRVREIATNSIAATPALSSATAAIGSPPLATGTLTQSGTASVGSTLTLTNSLTWTGYPPPLVSTQWYRCTARVSRQSITVPRTCSVISGATDDAYLLTSEDSGKFVAASRVATSTAGTVTVLAISTTTAIRLT